ncbi:hypothetical protein HYPSUDRAFT_205905 [Hypholoma sublateritium FD-334 SS-4]|uniref:F-box domain-containing protein n=1 Tax=Hypholoma sublateritium (strain FD-334 SS-4) TaxID=945553 RepID=A0A0D2PBZ0_HYPSF|nr:hypothetical protein HYPSUDRAFT_205905 [Hypholoma sublateritium FD-334 SS-4]
MSSIADDPPIHRLSHDLLLHIFEQNAHMFADDNALITTCITSQVCQTWRYLLLATPFLWGRLLDFDVLARSTGDGYWGDELSRNPREEEDYANQPQALHFLKTIQDNLHRLEILVVNLDAVEYVRHHGSWNKLVSLPAPQLQSFDLTVLSDRDGRRTPFGGVYFSPPASFADDAPRLRKFRAVQFAFNLQAPWVCCLREVYIEHSTSLSATLNALATTENLECLGLHAVWVAEDDEHLQTVHLHKLKELHLDSLHPSVCGILLDHLRIPSECALQYTLRLSTHWFADNVDNNFETALTAVIRRLSECARGYFLKKVPINLLFHYDENLLCITTHVQDDFNGFHLHIESPLLPHPKQIMATFLSEFTLPEFSHVTELHLEIAFNDKNISLLPFLGCLSSIRTLTTCCWDPDFFKFLKEKLDSPRSVLPLLRTIKMQKPRPPPSLSVENYLKDVDLSEFMDALDGYPVEVVFSR